MRGGRRTAWISVGLFLIALVVFRAAPRGQLYDSRFALLVSYQLLTQGDPSLDAFVKELGGVDAAGHPLDYRIVRAGGRYHWFYPLGTPLLATPFVAVATALGLGPVDAKGHYDRRAERHLQRWLAAVAMASVGVLFFLTARQLLPTRASELIAFTALFGSPILSTASRSLWSQTLSLLLISAALLLLMRGHRPGRSIRPIAMASLLAWAWLCRPTAAVPALALTVWVALRHRDSLYRLLGTAGVWLAVFLGFFRLVYEDWLPPYYRLGSHAFQIMPEALLGNLISPSRGLLIYSPIVLLVAAWLLTRRRQLPDPSLAVLAVSVIGLHWLLVSSHAPWWGGYGYGPRLMTETVPWLVLLAIVAWAAPSKQESAVAVPHMTLAATLMGVSILLNGIGAISKSAADWNHHQAEPDFAQRLWRPADAQFLAPLRAMRID